MGVNINVIISATFLIGSALAAADATNALVFSSTGAHLSAMPTLEAVADEIAEGAALVEQALRGDFAFVKAWRGDRWGNLLFRKTSRNFNPVMATAADMVIAEVEELVEVGELPPDQVHTPGVYVNAIFQGTNYEKRIEKRTVRKV